MNAPIDPREALERLGAVYSPDLDAYASGTRAASRVRCALCRLAPCECPPFGSAAYFAMLDRVHHPERPTVTRTCAAPECPLTGHVGEHPEGVALATGDYSAACIIDPPGRGRQ